MADFDFSILRELRKGAGLSIAELSGRSGVSAAVISKLERNQTRAEINTLLRLARVFDLGAAELLNLAEAGSPRRLAATGHQSEDFYFSEVRYRNLRCLYGRAPAGARVSRPKIHRDDFETCWVLRGRIRVTLPNDSYELGDGESLQFDALLAHTYEALAESELIIIHLRKDKRF